MQKKIHLIYLFDDDSLWVNNTLASFLELDKDIFEVHIFSAAVNDEHSSFLLKVARPHINLYRAPRNFDISACIPIIINSLNDGYIYYLASIPRAKNFQNIAIIKDNLSKLNSKKITFISSQDLTKTILSNDSFELDNDNMDEVINIVDFCNHLSISNFIFPISFVKNNIEMFTSKHYFKMTLNLLINYRDELVKIVDENFNNGYQFYTQLEDFIDEYTDINDILLDYHFKKPCIIEFFLGLRQYLFFRRLFNYFFHKVPKEYRVKILKTMSEKADKKIYRLYPNYKSNKYYLHYLKNKNDHCSKQH